MRDRKEELMELIAKFATQSPTIFKGTKLVISTIVGFIAKEGTEKVIDRLVEAGSKVTEG